MTATHKRILVLLAFALGVGAFFYFDLQRFTTFESVKTEEDKVLAFYAENPGRTIAWYFSAYVLATAISFPGASVLTLLGGALFGLFWGTIIVSLASTIGATLAFLAARYLLRDVVERTFGEAVGKINQGIAKSGDYYLFSLRLAPFVPFFVINLTMGLTKMSTTKFFVISQIGMLLGTIVYVNAGTELAQVRSLSDILTPGFIGGFAVLSLMPLGMKFLFRKTSTAP